MRWIYLSPHLDDAALSAGGLIHEQTQSGIPVEIWTLMCGYPPEDAISPSAQSLHAQWGFSSAEETAHERRIEDLNAAEIMGAKAVHFDFLDCIYRRGKNGRWLYSKVFDPPHEDDAQYPSQIAEVISARLRHDDVLVCQLSVGSHVDHVLVRQAAERLERPLRYIIDVPYIFNKPQELGPKSAGMKESTHSITESGLERWQEAVLAYKSQFPALNEGFNTPEKAREAIRTYWAEREGIRLLQVDGTD
jgi:LmbE family N-acetylglucosaminyl deacetylase